MPCRLLNVTRGSLSLFGHLCLVSPGFSHLCGSITLYRPRYLLTNSWIENNGRFVMAEFKYHEIVFRVVCLYAPNRNPDRDDFLASCASSIDPAIPTVICGDFNAVFNRSLDRRGSNIFYTTRESCSTLASFFND